MLIAVSRRPPLPQRKRAPRCRSALFSNQDPERDGRLLDPVALHPLALHLAGAADGGGAFARALLARLLIVAAQLHFAFTPPPCSLFFRAQESENGVLGKELSRWCDFRGSQYLKKKTRKEDT